MSSTSAPSGSEVVRGEAAPPRAVGEPPTVLRLCRQGLEGPQLDLVASGKDHRPRSGVQSLGQGGHVLAEGVDVALLEGRVVYGGPHEWAVEEGFEESRAENAPCAGGGSGLTLSIMKDRLSSRSGALSAQRPWPRGRSTSQRA